MTMRRLFMMMYMIASYCRFLDSMMQDLGSRVVCDAFCDIVYRYAAGPFSAYVDYIRNMPCQKDTLIKLR